MARELLKGTDYKLTDAMENPELTEKYQIMQAPTLVVVSRGKTEKYVNLSNIREYVEKEGTAAPVM